MRTELVTTLKRKATELLTALESDRAPILITQHGLPAAYLVDVETYERQQKLLGLLEGIAADPPFVHSLECRENNCDQRGSYKAGKSGPEKNAAEENAVQAHQPSTAGALRDIGKRLSTITASSATAHDA